MKLKRSIVIFPQFGSDTELIQNIRQQYDPLASKIAPHITLVFPFKSEISSSALHQHIKIRLNKFKPFKISLQGISQVQENYLFLNVVDGREQIVKIHNLIYSGILKQFLSKRHHYQPHITVGRFDNSSVIETAMDRLKSFDYKFKTEVNKISTEIILDDFSSTIDFEIVLN